MISLKSLPAYRQIKTTYACYVKIQMLTWRHGRSLQNFSQFLGLGSCSITEQYN